MTVIAVDLTISTMSSTDTPAKATSSRSPRISLFRFSSLRRTNTFPKIKRNEKLRRSVHKLEPSAEAPAEPDYPSQPNSSGYAVFVSSNKGIKRGFSEHVHRMGRNTLDKIGRLNRSRKLAEIELLEACTWLEQAGFPQYVQLLEESRLPIDLPSVQKDHEFLDQQQLQSLFRRLNTLNKSAHMKLDINSKKHMYVRGGEQDEEEACVLSDKWHFEKSSGRWSHVDTSSPTDTSVARMRSCSSRDSVMTDATTGDGDETGDSASPVAQSKSSINNNHLLNIAMIEPSQSESNSTNIHKVDSVPDNQAKQSKQRNGNFFQRHVGSLNRKTLARSSKKAKSNGGAPLISGPTLVNTPDMTVRMQQLGCIDIKNGSDTIHDFCNNNNSSASKPLLRSASADATASCCDCDSYSIDSSVIEYMLPEDYVLGTFPKELLPGEAPSRQNSISSRTKLLPHDTCTHTNDVTNQNSSNKPANRLSIYDNLSLDGDFELADFTTTESAADEINSTSEQSPAARDARRELDAVLKDLLYNITNLDLDSDDTSSNLLLSGEQRLGSLSIRNSGSHNNGMHLQVDSAIVSPGSEGLSSLNDSPLDTPADTPLDTPADTPELKRSITGSTQPELLTSTEELCVSGENIAEVEEVEADDGSIRETQETIWRERRDSGVGSSLTREPMERKKKVRLRWHSFVASHRPSFNSQSQQVSSLSAGQLMFLKRLALLKVTSLMEQYSPPHKSGFSLQLVNKFMKKTSRTPDYSDKKVFGVPLSIMLQRTGQPLPQCILHAMRYLRKSAPDAVGIFRKPGVKSRIQKLRNDLEQDPENVTQFDSMQSFDVADMFKQYLRELPECLVTNKLSETFLAIYQHVPQDLRLEALQACSLLLPDENREVLESLIYFLSDMAAHHEKNQMTASNLAMCFAPSLFNIHTRMPQTKSPKSGQKNVGVVVDQREFQDQRSATDCLTAMINDCKKVFKIPEDFLSKCSSSSSYMEAGEPAPLSLLSVGATSDYGAHVDSCIKGILKESKDKAWTSVQPMGLCLYNEDSTIEVSYKKVHDNNPLRLWKCSTEIEAPPVEVLNRVLNERQKWDEDLLKWRSVEKLEENLDIYQYVCHSMAPQPSREYLILRAWKQDLPKGSCVLVMHSIDHDVAALGGGIWGIVLASHYMIEPCGSGKSRITYISRIDGRGRQAKWYNRSYGSIAANTLLRIKESFTKPKAIDVHETKV